MILIFALLAAAQPGDAVLDDYAATVAGNFSTAAQHAADPRYDLAEARVARLWPERADGVWVYQEQRIAANGQSLAVYFQRIGHISLAGDGRLHRDNYAINDAGRFAGYGAPGYAGPAPAPADLGAPGCPNTIERVARGFYTASSDCDQSHYKGAARLQSRSIITPDTYANWDRGFDAAGARVWGPPSGGYLFVRTR